VGTADVRVGVVGADDHPAETAFLDQRPGALGLGKLRHAGHATGWTAAPVGGCTIGGGVFERFTDRARQVVVLAQEEARLLEHDHIGTEHILLGVLREDSGIGAQVLTDLGVTIEAVRDRVIELVKSDGPTRGEQIPFTADGKKALELALREALSFGHNYIGTEHLLLALFGDPDGFAAKILREGGATYGDVKNRVLEKLASLTA
jgi:ATP-dependent Clp protease ATP-binding subunit ClpC